MKSDKNSCNMSQIPTNSEKKVLGMLGLAKRCNKLSCGVEGVRSAMRSRTAKIVLLSHDASENTKKKIYDGADYYNAKIIEVGISMGDLSDALGTSSTATVAVSDSNIAKQIKKLLGLSGEKA